MLSPVRQRARSAAAARAVVALSALLALGACVEEPDPEHSFEAYRERLEALETRAFFQNFTVVDRHGTVLTELAPQGRRTWVSLEEMASDLQDAVVATEDRTFFENAGVDSAAVARALLQNARSGDTVSGASTITMQLVRMVAFDPEERFEPSLDRKVREAHLAAEIGERLPKSEILEAYLNLAYFGQQAYGAEEAARTYFGVSAASLSLAQASLLAGVLQAPARLDPLEHLQAARQRQQVVLAAMLREGYVTEQEADAAWGEPLGLVVERAERPPSPAPHFLDFALAELPRVLGPAAAANGGFTVTTTLDLELNQQIGAIAARHIAAVGARHDLSDVAATAVRPLTGEIVAMVGGVDYDEPRAGQVNVTTSYRQVGSAFKPITYAAALEDGRTPADVLWDVPFSFESGAGDYRPVNYDGRYRGPVRMRTALANSLNAAAVGLLADVGLERVHRLARDFGLDLDEDPASYGLSLTLGGAETPPLDLTAAYAGLAGGGQVADPTSILRVERILDGEILYELRPRTRQVVTPQTAFLVTSMLSDDAARQPAFSPGPPLETSRPTAVKTGTTDDFRDNLTVGYTPYLALGVWAGNKDGRPMRDALGITGAAPVWHDVMELVFDSPELLVELGDGRYPAFDFAEPPGIVRAAVCDVAAYGVAGCPTREELFAAGGRVGDPGTAYDLFVVLRSPGAVGPGCSIADRGTGRPMLIGPHRADLAGQVLAWAGTRGLAVAPPACDEASSPAGQVPVARSEALPPPP